MRVPADVGPLLCPTLPLLLWLVLAVPVASPTTAAAAASQSLEQQQQQHLGLQRLRGALRTAMSPEEMGLRAGGSGSSSSSSSSASVPPLVERPDRLFDPQPGDLNATLLRARLGRHFDPRVMSIQRPSRAQRRQHKTRYNIIMSPEDALLDDDQVEVDDEDFPFRRNLRGRLVPAGAMPPSIASLDLRGVPLPDGTRLRSRLSPRLRRKLQHFLWAYTACHVQRRWRDLGARFWPRWLREGHCAATPCSIPAGMHCQPAASRHQVLLRWHCRVGHVGHVGLPRDPPRPGDQGGGGGDDDDDAPVEQAAAHHCTWIKVEYPVITECSCGCSDDRYM